MTVLIDNLNQIEKDIPTLSFDDVDHMYGTGRSTTYLKNGYEKVVKYRNGVMTRVGDFEESVWEELIVRMIKRDNEETLYQQLYEWVKESIVWAKEDKEVKSYTLKLFAARIFDNPEWCDYYQFNGKYRPDKIDKN